MGSQRQMGLDFKDKVAPIICCNVHQCAICATAVSTAFRQYIQDKQANGSGGYLFRNLPEAGRGGSATVPERCNWLWALCRKVLEKASTATEKMQSGQGGDALGMLVLIW